VIALAFLLLAVSARALAQSPTPIEPINQYVTAEMKRRQIPGLSVAVLRGDRVLLARGYGFANLELRVPASDSTIYQSGSLGKQFTAAGVAMLAEQGRLRLDDGITQWFLEPNRSAGYQLVDGRIQNQDWVSPSLNTTADGALYFSIKDLVEWARALNHRRVPVAKVLDSAWSPVRLNDGGLYPYGFGWGLSGQRGW
jgi:CubicO group peptidase (beta-lactamase class C family)